MSRYIREKKQTTCRCKTLGFELTTSCILNGISYRYATSVHPLVIFVVRTRYLYTEQDNNEARVRGSLSRPGPGPRDGGTAGPHARLSRPVPGPCALLSRPGPGPRDGGTAHTLISPCPRSPRASLSPGPGSLDGGTARALISPGPRYPRASLSPGSRAPGRRHRPSAFLALSLVPGPLP